LCGRLAVARRQTKKRKTIRLIGFPVLNALDYEPMLFSSTIGQGALLASIGYAGKYGNVFGTGKLDAIVGSQDTEAKSC